MATIKEAKQVEKGIVIKHDTVLNKSFLDIVFLMPKDAMMSKIEEMTEQAIKHLPMQSLLIFGKRLETMSEAIVKRIKKYELSAGFQEKPPVYETANGKVCWQMRKKAMDLDTLKSLCKAQNLSGKFEEYLKQSKEIDAAKEALKVKEAAVKQNFESLANLVGYEQEYTIYSRVEF